MASVLENIKVDVTDSYDVIVAGGGIAGISSALASARQGAKVLLIENSYILGGLGTAGIITVYLPLCDGMGRQVSFGICEELIRLSVIYGSEDRYVPEWFEKDGNFEERKAKRFQVRYNPHLFAIEAEKLLLKNNVTILYGTKICSAKEENGLIKYIITENKSGRQAYECKAAIDCTGDADIYKFLGLKTHDFGAKNKLAAWYYFESQGKTNIRMLGAIDIPEGESGVEYNISDMKFTGLDGMEISKMVQLSHTNMLSDIKTHRETDKTYYPTNIPSIPQLRMTRRMIGEYEFDIKEEHKYFENSIGMISNWRERGPVYELPYEVLYSNDCKNLFAAGRCISVTDDMWDISRVIPSCAVTGEASGVAAALVSKGIEADVKTVQNILVKNGVVLHEKDL